MLLCKPKLSHSVGKLGFCSHRERCGCYSAKEEEGNANIIACKRGCLVSEGCRWYARQIGSISFSDQHCSSTETTWAERQPFDCYFNSFFTVLCRTLFSDVFHDYMHTQYEALFIISTNVTQFTKHFHCLHEQSSLGNLELWKFSLGRPSQENWT